MKSSKASCELSERLFTKVKELLPEVRLNNRSVTTSSIYCGTPDGYSLRIGDHTGREKYSYKWNLGPQYGQGRWKKEFNRIDKRSVWRYCTSSPEDLVEKIKLNWTRGLESSYYHSSPSRLVERAMGSVGQGELFSAYTLLSQRKEETQ